MELTTTSQVPSTLAHLSGDITMVHRRRFAVGIDVGQAHDPTAICVASRIDTGPLDDALRRWVPRSQRIEVMHLERLPLGMPYPGQVDQLERLVLRAPLVHLAPAVLIDQTGVGKPIFDMFKQRPALRRAQGVVITGGRETIETDEGWSVPKGTLISSLQALLHAGEMKIASGLPDAAVLARELQDFRVNYTDAGNATFNARGGAHDDLVLALALAVFGLGRSDLAPALTVRWSR